jgi:hypothetical protein
MLIVDVNTFQSILVNVVFEGVDLNYCKEISIKTCALNSSGT